MTETKAITIIEPTVTLPISVDAALKQWQTYEELKAKLLSNEDYQAYQDGKKRIKKSGWRKFATFFNLADQIVSEEIHRDDKGRVQWAKYEVRVTAPNGRSATAIHGSHVNEKCCPTAEGEPCTKDHNHCPDGCSGYRHWSHMDDIEATAHTRAKNRAISDLIGGGETSAEEVDPDKITQQPPADKSHWCEEHKTQWFKAGKMKGYAHAVKNEKGDTVAWCDEEKATKPQASSAKPADPNLHDSKWLVAQLDENEITNEEAKKVLGMSLAEWIKAGKTFDQAWAQISFVKLGALSAGDKKA